MAITFRLAIFTVSCLLVGALAGPGGYWGKRSASPYIHIYKRAAAPDIDIRSARIGPFGKRSAEPIASTVKRSASARMAYQFKRSAAPSPLRELATNEEATHEFAVDKRSPAVGIARAPETSTVGWVPI